VGQHEDHVDRERYEKQQKPFVVAVAETVVYENTVVVELLDAAVAEVTVVCILWPEGFAGHAYVVKVVVFFYQFVKQLLKVRLFLHVAWVDHGEGVEDDGRKEERSCDSKDDQLSAVLLLLP
jgi:hypothetical protein